MDDPQPSPFIDPQLQNTTQTETPPGSTGAAPAVLNLKPQQTASRSEAATSRQDRLAERGDYIKTASRSEAATSRQDRLAERGDYINTASRSEATTLSSRSEATAQIKLVAHEAQPQPQPGPGEVVAPRRDVSIEGFNELGIVVIRAENPADAEAILKIIEIIRQRAAGAEIQIRMVELKQADATSVVNTLNQLFVRVQVTGSGFGNSLFTPRTSTQSTVLGQTQSAQLQAASVALIPMPRFNGILIATAKARMKQIIREIDRLDKKNAKQRELVPFRLRKASAARVATLVNTFWATRYPETNQIRVTYEDSTNQVFVQAAPADLVEIQQLIWNIDNTVARATNDIRIVRLKPSFADQVASLLLRAVNDGVLTTTNPAG